MTTRFSLSGLLDRVATDWSQTKTFIEHMIGFSHDALHVMVGVCLQLLFAGLLRRSARSVWPWLMVLGLELANDWVDLHVEVWPDHGMQWGESAKDVVLTMFLPSVIWLVARFCPQLLHERKAEPGLADANLPAADDAAAAN